MSKIELEIGTKGQSIDCKVELMANELNDTTYWW